ncbi:MBL fold metallo-hydrolase RNA specificity domain-containing protein [Hahella ganghwensis]|uniref:MBL fold metallo-hydrolase RNA specificity domain-containing protein n=1 Tax=Hahella ganghwensis TaxID=286420 RepID=UPI00037040E5|nr:MBL fold metallo-hydrolase [Hahella ganghwensis]
MKSVIKHHGATNGVTGSCHELKFGEAGFLIDCGLFQGDEAAGKSSADDLKIDFPIEHIQALIVTHVHIDHVGRIPYLLAAGFKGPIYCSEPSALLLPEILEDALKIGFTRNRELIEKVLGYLKTIIQPVPYGEWLCIYDSDSRRVKLKLERAGHILGSAYATFQLLQGDNDEHVVFSGDVGASNAPLLPEAKSPERCDRLVIESTYGDRIHEGRENRVGTLRQVLKRCLADNGVVLIPAFSIGRTQELLYEIEETLHDDKIKEVGKFSEWEVVVDSPLAARFTEHYRNLAEFWDKEARERREFGRHPLNFYQLTTIASHDHHKAFLHRCLSVRKPRIVIAGSGMCNGGRIVNYLKAFIGDPTTDILFVGYQASGTIGRQILKHSPDNGFVVLDGNRFDIRSGVYSLSGYSAHADQQDLIDFVSGIRIKPKEIRIVHGDERAKKALQSKLKALSFDSKVIISRAQETE